MWHKAICASASSHGDEPGDCTLRQPIERRHAFPEARWHLLPGNHDGHQANGFWDRLRKRELPDNVVLHLAPGSHAVAGEAVLCCRRRSPAAMRSAIPPRTWTAW